MRPGGKLRCGQAGSLGRSYRKVSRAIALPPDSVLAILEGSDQAESFGATRRVATLRVLEDGKNIVFARTAFFAARGEALSFFRASRNPPRLVNICNNNIIIINTVLEYYCCCKNNHGAQ